MLASTVTAALLHLVDCAEAGSPRPVSGDVAINLWIAAGLCTTGYLGGGVAGQPGGNVVAGGRGAGEGCGQGPPVRPKQKTRVDPFGDGLPLRARRLAITDDRLALEFGRGAHDLSRNGPPPGRGRGVEPRGQQLGSVSGHPLPADLHTAEQRDPVTVRTAGAGSIGHETSPSSPP